MTFWQIYRRGVFRHGCALVGLLLLSPNAVQAGLAEFSFCPLGGPPGWYNRLTGHNERHYRYRWWPARIPAYPTAHPGSIDRYPVHWPPPPTSQHPWPALR